MHAPCSEEVCHVASTLSVSRSNRDRDHSAAQHFWRLVCGFFHWVARPYYVIAGVALIVSGVLMIVRREASLWWNFALFSGTIVCALFEVGLDGRKLMPRVFLLSVLGIWCSFPMSVRPLTARVSAGGGT